MLSEPRHLRPCSNSLLPRVRPRHYFYIRCCADMVAGCGIVNGYDVGHAAFQNKAMKLTEATSLREPTFTYYCNIVTVRLLSFCFLDVLLENDLSAKPECLSTLQWRKPLSA